MTNPSHDPLPYGLQELLEMTRALAATSDLDTLLNRVVESSMRLLDAERATLFLYDAAKEELFTRVAKDVEGFRISVKTGFAGAAARTRQTVHVPDAYADARFNPDVDRKTGYRTRNILSCPLVDLDNQLVGVLQVLNKHAGDFLSRDIALAEAFSAQAGVALQRAKLLVDYLAKQRLEQALQIACEVQQRLFPKTFPRLASCDIAGWNRPCDAIGGDCCDFIDVGDHRYALVLGDVTGHGIGPALMSCTARAMLRTVALMKEDVTGIMNRVNALLAQDLKDSSFVTIFLGVLDDRTGELSYLSAGQGPLLWYHAATGQVDIHSASGIPMGIIGDYDYGPPERIILQPGDIFGLLTDGFFEWANLQGQQVGVERISEAMICYSDRDASTLLKCLVATVEEFVDTPQGDDLTGIILKRY